MRLELTRRGDYAIRSVIALARIADGTRLSVRQLADAEGIPVRFLPQVMADLGRAGLVEAVAGRTGGYRLARPAREMTLLDVIEAVEGNIRRHTCVLRGGACGVDGACAVHSVFSDAQDDLLARIARATVASVADHPASR